MCLSKTQTINSEPISACECRQGQDFSFGSTLVSGSPNSTDQSLIGLCLHAVLVESKRLNTLAKMQKPHWLLSDKVYINIETKKISFLFHPSIHPSKTEVTQKHVRNPLIILLQRLLDSTKAFLLHIHRQVRKTMGKT